MNILAIGAHPDDIELGCAGTLLKYVRTGHNVYLLIMTKGGRGGDSQLRSEEQEEAARRLGAKEVIWGNCEDTKLKSDNETVSFIEDVVNRVNPKEVYVNYLYDTHQDHRALAQAAISATRFVPRVLYYEDYTSVDFNPSIYVDISDVLKEKMNVIAAHSSQVERMQKGGRTIIDGITAWAHFRGFHGRTTCAEGFLPVRYLKMISDF